METVINNNIFETLLVKEASVFKSRIPIEAWDANLKYYKDDVVLFSSSLYKCIQDITYGSIMPGSSPAYWQKINNHYLKLTNGLIIQWGQETFAATRDKTITVTFPIPFSDGKYNLNFTPICTDNYICLINSHNKTNSSCNIRGYVNSDSKKLTGISWFAIGF